MHKITESITKPVGILRIRVTDLSGYLLEQQELFNVITNNTMSQLRYLIAGDSVESRKITTMKFGTSSTEASASQSDLLSAIAPTKTVSVSYPTGTTTLFNVKFSTTLEANEANGFNLREAGLFFADGTMAARRVFSSIEKSNDRLISFEWTLSFGS